VAGPIAFAATDRNASALFCCGQIFVERNRNGTVQNDVKTDKRLAELVLIRPALTDRDPEWQAGWRVGYLTFHAM